MSELEPIYRRPDLKLIMSELIAQQGVAEAVEIVFVEDNVIYVDFEQSEPEDIVA